MNPKWHIIWLGQWARWSRNIYRMEVQRISLLCYHSMDSDTRKNLHRHNLVSIERVRAIDVSIFFSQICWIFYSGKNRHTEEKVSFLKKPVEIQRRSGTRNPTLFLQIFHVGTCTFLDFSLAWGKSMTTRENSEQKENSPTVLKRLNLLCSAAQNVVPWHFVNLHPYTCTQCCCIVA